MMIDDTTEDEVERNADGSDWQVPPTPRAELLAEIDRLRTRVAELEADYYRVHDDKMRLYLRVAELEGERDDAREHVRRFCAAINEGFSRAPSEAQNVDGCLADVPFLFRLHRERTTERDEAQKAHRQTSDHLHRVVVGELDVLRAEVGRMRPVVKAAAEFRRTWLADSTGESEAKMWDAVDAYLAATEGKSDDD